MSKLDSIYRSILLTKYFVKGWGKPDILKKIINFRKIMSNRNECQHLVPSDYPVHIDKEQKFSTHKIIEGHFKTPVWNYLPEILPEECVTARFQMVLPNNWSSSYRPVCIHLAGTGDHGFKRRQILMAQPLLKEAGIASIILENPFYGCRKPVNQIRSSLHNVSDLFIMGTCLILECLVLLHWCERQQLGPLGITGISMGGHMASIAGSNWHKPLAIIPCLSWTTASCAFTQGVLTGAIPWNVLETQYLSNKFYQDEIIKLLRPPEESDVLLDKNYFAQKKSLGLDVSKWSKKLIKKKSNDNIENVKERRSLRMEALKLMRGIMDECTHIGNFSVPVDPSLCMFVAATDDQYIPRDGLKKITDFWPGAEVRYIQQGHVMSFLFYQSFFRKAIRDVFDKMASRYPNS